MQHPETILRPEYIRLMGVCELRAAKLASSVAVRLLRDLAAYQAVEAATGVKALWLMATNERESSGNLSTYLGNGESLKRVTRLVPRGRGPFLDPNAWSNGAIDALKLDHIDQVKIWDWPMMCYEWELWNGFGYRDHHNEHTPYVWGGTTVEQKGKYIADGQFDANTMDTQLGTVSIARAIVALRPELDVSGWDAPSISPSIIPDPQPLPVGVGGGTHDAQWIQHALNVWGATEAVRPNWLKLDEDNNFGRTTRIAVRQFQAEHKLHEDGVPGATETIPALEEVMSHAA